MNVTRKWRLYIEIGQKAGRASYLKLRQAMCGWGTVKRGCGNQGRKCTALGETRDKQEEIAKGVGFWQRAEGLYSCRPTGLAEGSTKKKARRHKELRVSVEKDQGGKKTKVRQVGEHSGESGKIRGSHQYSPIKDGAHTESCATMVMMQIRKRHIGNARKKKGPVVREKKRRRGRQPFSRKAWKKHQETANNSSTSKRPELRLPIRGGPNRGGLRNLKDVRERSARRQGSPDIKRSGSAVRRPI